MSKSIAELRASTRTSLPVWSKSICLAQGLVAEVQTLEEEWVALSMESPQPDEENAPPRRLADRPDPRFAEIQARKAEIYAEMREHTGELRIQAKPAGEWRRFVDANPPRKDNKVDETVAYGLVDADALLEHLGEYVLSWNDDPLTEGDWEFIANRAPAGDLKDLVSLVVQMHEARGALAPKSPTPLSPTGSSATS